MNRTLRIALSLPILATAHAAAAEASLLRFANGDLLSGQMENLSPEQLVWKSPALEHAAPFFLKNVLELTLPTREPESQPDHLATVTLTNGDVVRGQLASLQDGQVALDTWYAGRLVFNRPMVADLRIEVPSAFLYQGPTGLDGWTQKGEAESPAWRYTRRAFVSGAPGSIARAGLLPDECHLSFDLAWKADALGLKVVLFSEDPARENPSSGYEMTFQRGTIYLRNCRTQSFLGSTHSSALAERDRVHIEIRASRKTGKVSLHIDKRIVEVWDDPDFARGRFGDTLHLISQNTLPLRISNLGVAAWDGVIEETPEPRVGMMRQFGLPGLAEPPKPAPPKEKPANGRMELANGDSIEGEVAAIENGILSIKSPLGDLKLPADRLRTISLKKVDLERCIRRNGDIRAWFPDGGSLVFRLDAVGEGTLTGSSQNFGSATFKLAAFSRIEFNIYEPTFEDKRAAEDW